MGFKIHDPYLYFTRKDDSKLEESKIIFPGSQCTRVEGTEGMGWPVHARTNTYRSIPVQGRDRLLLGVPGSGRQSPQSQGPLPWGGGPERTQKIGIPFFFAGPFPNFSWDFGRIQAATPFFKLVIPCLQFGVTNLEQEARMGPSK